MFDALATGAKAHSTKLGLGNRVAELRRSEVSRSIAINAKRLAAAVAAKRLIPSTHLNGFGFLNFLTTWNWQTMANELTSELNLLKPVFQVRKSRVCKSSRRA
ncbi:hypothetical protein [Bradyrhizobium sp. CCBAU 53380]|uniref:hypothetical protein n=1 Tax=unclassified Bradyrhizobium TaxID=2631580 RepID=UPI000A7BE3F3|nr:hypothetical protein [Bradyrhizobium sp. CCBAU 53380]